MNWLSVCAAASFVGMVGLAVSAMLHFEEPNQMWLIGSSVLMLVGPVAILVHVMVTRELTRDEKRLWIRQLISRRAAWALSDYLTCDDRSTLAHRFAGDAGRD